MKNENLKTVRFNNPADYSKHKHEVHTFSKRPGQVAKWCPQSTVASNNDLGDNNMGSHPSSSFPVGIRRPEPLYSGLGAMATCFKRWKSDSWVDCCTGLSGSDVCFTICHPGIIYPRLLISCLRSSLYAVAKDVWMVRWEVKCDSLHDVTLSVMCNRSCRVPNN